jgi:multidrug resistance efflux pump
MVSELTGNNASGSPASVPAAEARPTSLSDRVRSLRLQEKPARPPARPTWLPWTLCLLLAVGCGVLGFFAFAAQTGRETPEAKTSDGGSPGAGAGTSPDAVASSGEVALERKGYVIDVHRILISPKVSGVIMDMNVYDGRTGKPKGPLEEGKRVQEGDILAQLETVDYQADYDHSKAVVNSCWQKFLELYTGNRQEEIKQAKADLDEMEANRKQLEADWKRSVDLQPSRALAVRDFEQAESLYKAMEHRVEKMRQAYQLMLEGPRIEKIEAAWADFETAEADLAKARWRLDNCRVLAPISGTILTKKAEIGNLVNPIAFAGSLNICEMANLADLEVDLTIEERDISKIFVNQPCKAYAEAYPNRIYTGRVSRLMPTADRAKSAIPVRVRLDVPQEEEGVYLKPDMSVVVSFLKKQEKSGK